jgi:5-methylcytosine-specific restriction endonuclease McrA
MRRTYIRESFTDTELENIRSGKCWCGKPRSEFQKGMRAYCSPDHRSIWQSKILTWSEFRNQFLQEHGEKCDICGIGSPRSEYERAYRQKEKEREEAILALKPKVQDAIIAKKIDQLESDFERRFAEIMDPSNIDKYDVERYAKLHRMPLPELPSWYESSHEKRVFEVDHIQAIVNGGNEFDKTNLQVLCSECHKKKTKQDMQIANGLRINISGIQASIDDQEGFT